MLFDFYFSIGMLLQFSSNVVCRDDGTLRISEPGTGKNFSCVAVFFLTYFFELAFSFWIMAYLMFRPWILKGSGKRSKKWEDFIYIVYMSGYVVPIIATLTVICLHKIDGYSLSGICHVSFYSRTVEFGTVVDSTYIWIFVVGKDILIAVITIVLLYCYWKYFNTYKVDTKWIIGCGMIFVLCKFYTFGMYSYFATKISDWDDSFEKYLICKFKLTNSDVCNFDKPSTGMMYLQQVSTFLPGFYFLAITDKTNVWKTLKDCINRLMFSLLQEVRLHQEVSRGTMRRRKSHVIADAYNKRDDLQNHGHLSLTLCSTQNDSTMAKMRSDGVSEAESFASSFFQALPRIIQRRNAVVGDQIRLGPRGKLSRSISIGSNLSGLSRSYSMQSNRLRYSRNSIGNCL